MFEKLGEKIKNLFVGEGFMDNQANEDLKLISNAFFAIDQNKKLFAELIMQYEGRYDDDTRRSYEKCNRSAIFVPLSSDYVDRLASQFKAAFFTGKNPIEIIGEDKQKTLKLSRFITKKIRDAKPSDELMKAFKASLIYGFSCVMLRWDEKKQIPITTYLPVECFALDPKSVNIRDSKYCCYRQSINYIDCVNLFGEQFVKVVGEKRDDERVEIREIYKKDKDGNWIVRSYVGNNLIREESLLQLPFFYGYAITKIPVRKDTPNDEDLFYFGQSLLKKISGYQKEINKKRNQKIDIDELAINPKYVYTSDFNPEILGKGAGAGSLVDRLDSYRELQVGNVNVDNDISILKAEVEQTTGLNGVHLGVTSQSDRRSAPALEILASSGSTLIEDMITTINDTLFSHWANGFVNLLQVKTDVKTAEEEGLSFSNDMKINFGSTISKARKVENLSRVFQIASQSNQIPQEITTDVFLELMDLLLDGEYNLESLSKTKKINPEAMGGL